MAEKTLMSVKEFIAMWSREPSMEVREATLYDALTTTAAVSNDLEFFRSPSNNTRQKTNMNSQGQIPAPQRFLVTEIGFRIYNLDGTPFFTAGAGAGAATAYPVNAIVAKGSFDLFLQPKTRYEGHLALLYKQFNLIYDTTADKKAVASVPGSFEFKTKKLRMPMVILPARTFSVKLNVTTPAEGGGYTAANTVIMCELSGLMADSKS